MNEPAHLSIAGGGRSLVSAHLITHNKRHEREYGALAEAELAMILWAVPSEREIVRAWSVVGRVWVERNVRAQLRITSRPVS